MKPSMPNREAILIASLLVFAGKFTAGQAWCAEKSQNPNEKRDTYVLIVSGISKDPNHLLVKNRVVTDLQRFFLAQAKIKSERLCLLLGNNSGMPESPRVSTADNVKEALTAFAAKSRPMDRFIFYYVGQANTVAGELRLNLPGEDITHLHLSEWINGIKASSMLIVLDCPGAGLAVKTMTGKGRVVVCGCTENQQYSTKFGEFFVPALARTESDSDGDGRVSVLEAFAFASKQLEQWYRQRNLLKTETPVLEDNADGTPNAEPWRYELNKEDGLLASEFFLVDEQVVETKP